MKLFRVKVEFDLVVAAGDENGACRYAIKEIDTIARNDPPNRTMAVREIDSDQHLPEGWSVACAPWGSDRTIAQHLGYEDQPKRGPLTIKSEHPGVDHECA